MITVGASGAHGVGKTTVLKALEVLGYNNVVVDMFSVPRNTQDTLGITLEQLRTDRNVIQRFQTQCLKTKSKQLGYLREQHEDTDNIVFTDRTPMDFYAYARTYIEQTNGCQDWLEQYKQECLAECYDYDLILLIPSGKFGTFVPEAQRGPADTQQRNNDYQHEFATCVENSRVHLVQSTSVADRVAEFLRVAQAL